MEKTPSFDKAFDFNFKKAKKLNNSSYLEELTGLFEKATSKIDEGVDYYFEKDFYVHNPNHPNSSYDEFTKEFIASFDKGSSGKIYLILGQSGVGKSLFFEKGIQKLIHDKASVKGKYIKLGIDFTSIAINEEKKPEYIDWIYKTLNDNARDAIRKLKQEDSFEKFDKCYEKFCKGHYDTPDAKLFPVLYFCKRIYEDYKKPCIIVFDNIDLASINAQNAVFRDTGEVCKKLKELMEYHNCKEHYRIYFAMRPETKLIIRHEVLIGNIINFPFPNILKISLEILKKALLDAAEELDKQPLAAGIKFFDIIEKKEENVKTHKNVALYFNKILDHYLNNIWNKDGIIDRLGTSEEFHCNIVDYNLRTFLTFLADTLGNGGFKPLTHEFNKGKYERYYTVFDYIEMIIRGRWEIHPSNKFVDGEGRARAPIVFNIFDDNSLKCTLEDKIKHFMLNIRILQMFSFQNDEEATYGDVKDKLCDFFDENRIENATKKLVHMRVLYSHEQGVADIASKKHWTEVSINANTTLKLENVGRFYLEKFICEFEYLYQMALSSLMPSLYIKDVIECYDKHDKEQIVLYFLKGIFEILKINTSEYNKEELANFKKYFCQGEKACKPYRRMLESFINTLNTKIKAARDRKTRNLYKLDIILSETKILRENTIDYFSSKLGEQ